MQMIFFYIKKSSSNFSMINQSDYIFYIANATVSFFMRQVMTRFTYIYI